MIPSISKKLIWTAAVVLTLTVSAALFIKLSMVQERHQIIAREDSDFLHPLAPAVSEFRKNHGRWPTSLDEVSKSDTVSDFIASEYFRRGKLIWNTDGKWTLTNKSHPICWFWSDDHWFYVGVLSEDQAGELAVQIVSKKELRKK